MTSEITAMVATMEFWVGVAVALAFEELVKDKLVSRLKTAIKEGNGPGIGGNN